MLTSDFNATLISYKTLAYKEIKRFFKIYHQTIISPVVSALLFFGVFFIALRPHTQTIGGINFEAFMFSGLIAMIVIQNCFGNSSYTLLIAKVNGSIVDYLVPPFSPFQILFCITLSSVIRSLLICFLSYCALSFIFPIVIYNYLLFGAYLVLSSILVGLIGCIAGIVARRFDDMAAVTNYFIVPLSFLSCTFYSYQSLPNIFKKIIDYNPLFYVVDLIRYSLTGVHESNLLLANYVVIICTIICAIVNYYIIKSGWNLKK